MLIHSVTSHLLLTEQPKYSKPVYKQFEDGYLEGIDTPGGFMLSRIHSTNLETYLKAQYTPGGIIGTGTK